MAKKPLSPLQQRFVAEYIADPDSNATKAYIAAGYKATGRAATACAARLLACANIQVAIEREMRRLLIKADIKAENLLLELKRIAFLDPRDVFEWGPDGVVVKESSKLTMDVAACVVEVSQTVTKDGGTIRVKLADKMQAIDKLGQFMRLWKSLVEHTGADGGPIDLHVRTTDRIERHAAAFAAAAARGASPLPLPSNN